MAGRIVPLLFDPACAHSEWHLEIVRGVQKCAAGSQKQVQVFNHVRDVIAAKAHVCDPVILTGFSPELLSDAVRRLSEADMRMVLAAIDADSLSAPISCVTHSRSQQAVQLVQYLHACGRKKIALVGAGRNSLNDLVKVNAARQYTARLEHSILDGDVFMWEERLDDCLDAFLPVARRYDAVICPSDYIALLLLNRLRARGVNVPDSLYIASFGNSAISRFCAPSITTIMMDFSAIGRYAFAVWQQLQTLTDPGLVSKVIAPSRLLVRGTTAYQRPAPRPAEAPLFSADRIDRFYHEPTLTELLKLEGYLTRRDELDLQIIAGLMDARSYEELTDQLYISSGTLHYRLSKLYHDLDCQTRKEFVQKISTIYGCFVVHQGEE